MRMFTLLHPIRQHRAAALVVAVAQELERAADLIDRAQAHAREAHPGCCEGRPAGHTGEHWPLGATHPARA
jgi:hypothetical protein